MTKHVLAVHHITLQSRTARVTPSSSSKRATPLSSSDKETTNAPNTEPLTGCSTVKQPTTVTQYSPISDADQPYSPPVPQPIVVIHFNTDDQELFVPTITNVRTVTAMTNPSSPICISDSETNQPRTPGPPPMKKLRVTLEPSSIPPGTPLDTVTPSPRTTLLTINHRPSTSTNDLHNTMAQLEFVWKARMDSHITDKLAEHDSAITKRFVVQDQKITS